MAETLANGTVVPQGSDPIHASGVQWGRNMGASIDAQLGDRYTKAVADSLLAGKVSATELAVVQTALDALSYNSGPRDLKSGLYTGFSAAWVYTIRVGSVVSVFITNLSYTGGSTGTVSAALFPYGLRPPATAYAISTRGKTVLLTSSGVLQVVGPGASFDSVSFTYLTSDPIPATPPGDPV